MRNFVGCGSDSGSYSNQRTYGHAVADIATSAPPEAVALFPKFNAFVQRSSDRKGCWLWIAGTDSDGYGLISNNPHPPEKVHRLAWKFKNGPIPEGMSVLHKCDNPPCVNYDHLFLGTHTDNMRDAIQKGRKNCWGHQKLNADLVRAIRLLAACGDVTQKEIGERFGVARNSVSEIVSRKRWSHVA